MTAVTTIKPHLATIECPDALRGMQVWVCWRYEHHDGETKQRKVPYYASGARRHGVQGRLEDRQQLVTFDAAKAAAMRRGMDGVGFCPLPQGGIVALDFDNCVAAGGVHPEVERAVAGTYAEFSPSGNGVRAFLRGEDMGNRKSHGLPYGFEVFSSKGFVTFTGNRLPITELTDAVNTVAEVPEDVRLLCVQRFGRADAPEGPANDSDVKPLGLTPDQLREALDVLPLDLDYDAWFSVGCALHHETGGTDEGFELWDAKFSGSSKYSTRDYGRYKWDSMGRGGQRPITAHALVRMANANGAHIEIASLEADDFDVVASQPPAPAKPLRFMPVPAGQFAAAPPPEWLIKDLLPRAELAVIFGEPGAGKSFIALDLVGALARGVEWRGRKTKLCRVIIIAAEGAGGMRKRIKAWAQHHGVDLASVSIGVIHAAPNLMQKQDAFDLAKAIQAYGGADVVLIDTLAQSMAGGNENAGEDMGLVLGHCRGVHVATKALVLLVHHSGKDKARGARGWSGIKGAADVEIEVSKLPTGRVMRLSKQKDGEDGTAWGFALDVVTVGADDDGDPITSCVVKEADAPAVHQVEAASRGMGKLQRAVLGVVNEMAEAQTEGIEVEAVLAEVVRRTGREGQRNARSHASRALNELCQRDDVAYELTADGTLRVV